MPAGHTGRESLSVSGSSARSVQHQEPPYAHSSAVAGRFARRCAARAPGTPSEFPTLTTRCLEKPARLLACLLGAVCLALQAAPAETIVNTTIHVPASVQTNPCFPADVVNLSGDIHIVITTTTAASGGYRVNNHLNSQLSGLSITTGTRYLNSENKDDEWYTRPPFPTVHTQTYDLLLVSQSNTPNDVLHMTLHEAVTANGVPAATVDRFSMDCQG
jgi:hypothetical protein